VIWRHVWRDRHARAGGVYLDVAAATASFLDDQPPGGSAYVVG
jgi:hypothetical protein